VIFRNKTNAYKFKYTCMYIIRYNNNYIYVYNYTYNYLHIHIL